MANELYKSGLFIRFSDCAQPNRQKRVHRHSIGSYLSIKFDRYYLSLRNSILLYFTCIDTKFHRKELSTTIQYILIAVEFSAKLRDNQISRNEDFVSVSIVKNSLMLLNINVKFTSI